MARARVPLSMLSRATFGTRATCWTSLLYLIRCNVKRSKKYKYSFCLECKQKKVKTKNLIEFLPVNANSILSNLNLVNFFRLLISISLKIFFFLFSFRAFPSIRGSHRVLSASKPSCLQHPSPLHQRPPYLLSLDLKIFFLVSLFFSFLVTPFLSFFFLHSLCLSS